MILRSSFRMKIGRDFGSEVTWQYRKVTGQIASGFATGIERVQLYWADYINNLQ